MPVRLWLPWCSDGSAVMGVDHHILLGQRDTRLLGACLTSHGIRLFGKDSSRSRRSSVSLRLPLEDTRLKVPSAKDTDVLYVKLFSTEFVVLNSSEAICDLLEKRSTIYSDRVSHLTKPPSRSLSHDGILAYCTNARTVRHPSYLHLTFH